MSKQDARKFKAESDPGIKQENSLTGHITMSDKNSAEVAALNRQMDLQAGRFDAILSSISDFAYMFDKQGRFLFINQALLNLWGMKLEEAVGKNFFELKYPDDLATRLQAQIQEVFNTKKRVTDETFYRSPTGINGYYEYIFSPIFAPDGVSVELVAGTTRDITERKQIENALRISEENYRHLFNSIDEGFCVIEVLIDEESGRFDHRFIEINPSFSEQTGLTEVRGKKMRELAPLHEEFWFETFGKIALTGEAVRFEHLAASLNRWFDVYAFRIGKPDERKVAVLFKNISERKQTENQIKSLNELNRNILESITDAFFAIDGNWRFTYVNPQAEQMLDRSPGDLLGKIIWEVYPGLIGSKFEDAYRRAANEKIQSVVTEYYPDHERWYEVNVYPAHNGITIYFRNITERVKTEERLKQTQAETERQRRLYDTILSNSPDLSYVFDLDHRFTYANEILLKMWGKSWDEAIGKTCLELGYEPWHAEMHDREIEQVVATKRAIRGEVPFTGTFGRRIYDYIFVPVFGSNGEVEAVAGTTRDVTDRKEMEEALQQADRRKDEFLATLAHELRNPLAPIRSGLEIIRRLGHDQIKLNETLDIIERQTNQIVHLVDDLLDISRITQGKIHLRCERIKLKTAIEMALETSRALIDESENELTVTLPFKPIYIDADLTRIAQIFLNILNNAAKYSNRGGKISLTAGKDANEAVISIKDTGIGIEPEMLTQIFDMFGQIETADEQARGGLGIGLSVVKKLVELHNGSIEVLSEGRGKGSEFIVRLPLSREQSDKLPARKISEKEILQTAQMKVPQTGENTETHSEMIKNRILVVDDNRDAAEMLETLLTIKGHIIRTAFDGRTAIEIAKEFQPQICLCDIGLPEMNGYELAAHLRKILPQSLLISVSGWGREEDRLRSSNAGFNYHLVKPVEFDDLLKVIDDQPN